MACWDDPPLRCSVRMLGRSVPEIQFACWDVRPARNKTDTQCFLSASLCGWLTLSSPGRQVSDNAAVPGNLVIKSLPTPNTVTRKDIKYSAYIFVVVVVVGN